MLRSTSLLGLVLASLSSVFATGCLADAQEPAGIIWYDDGFNACFTLGKDGKPVEVPCDETMAAPIETQYHQPGIGCTTPDDCDRSGNGDE